MAYVEQCSQLHDFGHGLDLVGCDPDPTYSAGGSLVGHMHMHMHETWSAVAVLVTALYVSFFAFMSLSICVSLYMCGC